MAIQGLKNEMLECLITLALLDISESAQTSNSRIRLAYFARKGINVYDANSLNSLIS
jgi:hypothetical protein